MNTFKTAFVVVMMLGIAYGGWKLVNGNWKLVSASDGSSVLPDGIGGTIPWAAPSVEFPAPNHPEAPPFDPQGASHSDGLPVVEFPSPGPGNPAARSGGPPPTAGPPPDAFPVPPFGAPGELPEFAPVTVDPASPAPEKNGSVNHTPPPASRAVWEEPIDPPAAPSFSQPIDPGNTGDASHDPRAASPLTATSDAFEKAWRTGIRQIEQDQLKDALYTLSAWLGSPDLTPEQADQLQTLLDQLAGTVVYSDEHLMEPAYVARRGERLQDIAALYHVPWQMLAKINGIEQPYVLLPSQRLKVVKGPFAARIDLQQQQIFLYLRGYYAGRFVFTAGRDQPPRPGTYQVVSKMEQRTWYDERGYEVPPEHADNPYGPFWIDLGSNLCIHGAAASGPDRGCVSVSPRDAEDLYGILDVGSQVIIR